MQHTLWILKYATIKTKCAFFMIVFLFCWSKANFIWKRHGVKVGPGPHYLGLTDSGSRDWEPPQSLKVGPGTSIKLKSETSGPPSKFRSRTPGPHSKFKSGTPIIIFLHCLTYFVLDKYVYNREIIFHK